MRLTKFGGVAAVAGGMLLTIMLSRDLDEASAGSIHAFTLATPLLLMVALAGLCAAVWSRVGGSGRAGLATALGASAVAAVGSVVFYLLYSLGFLAMFVGLVVAGGAILREWALPRWNALPLAIGVLGILIWVTSSGYPAGRWGEMGAFYLTLSAAVDLCWVFLGVVLLSRVSRAHIPTGPTRASRSSRG